jgi:glycosyltransferase involved in cell wall biosynthesis
MNKIKVLHLVESLDDFYGGPAKSIPLLCSSINSNIFNVEIHSVRGKEADTNYFCEKYSVRWMQHKYVFFRSFSLSISMFVYIFKIVVANRRVIIHTHNFWNFVPMLAYFLKIFFRNKVVLVISLRGNISREQTKKKIVWALFQKNMIKIADSIHVTNLKDYNNIIYLNSNVQHIPNGLLEQEKLILDNDCNKIFKPKNKKKYFLYVARIHADKGLHYLIDAWIDLSKNYLDWDLVVVGHVYDDEYFANLNSLVNSNNLSDRFHFLGSLKPFEVECAYVASDVFVLPTCGENFGLSIAEALSFGLPVITTNKTPWSSISKNNAGYIINLTFEELRCKMLEIISLSSSDLKLMRSQAIKVSKKIPSWREVGALTTKNYQKLTDESV